MLFIIRDYTKIVCIAQGEAREQKRLVETIEDLGFSFGDGLRINQTELTDAEIEEIHNSLWRAGFNIMGFIY